MKACKDHIQKLQCRQQFDKQDEDITLITTHKLKQEKFSCHFLDAVVTLINGNFICN